VTVGIAAALAARKAQSRSKRERISRFTRRPSRLASSKL
jgi:hypothetical protein